jgi:hypothetical protein
LFRKAQNGTMKTFVPQGVQWYNENICPWRQHSPFTILSLAATFYKHATPLGSIFTFLETPFLPLAAQIPPKSQT